MWLEYEIGMRKFSLMIIVILVTAMLCGFASHKLYGYTRNDFYYIVDEETGVNYVVLSDTYKGGICPRYNRDGSLYTSRIK